MNFSLLKSFQGIVCGVTRKILEPKMFETVYTRGIHRICNQFPSTLSTITNGQNISKPSSFLAPTFLPLFNQVCGMKQRGQLQLRCKGCYYVARQERLYVMCKLKPRHKQMQMIKSFKKRRILTFAHQKKVRDW